MQLAKSPPEQVGEIWGMIDNDMAGRRRQRARRIRLGATTGLMVLGASQACLAQSASPGATIALTCEKDEG